MLDEALREFRRVAELRPADASAPFYLGLIAAAAGALGGGGRRPSGRPPARPAPKPAALHNLGYALERLGRLDEAEAAYGDAAGRARDDARIMLGWSVVALKRGEHQVAQGRLARALELLGGKPAPAALVLGRRRSRAPGSTTRRARSGPRAAGVGRFPAQRGAAEQSRGAARADRRRRRAPRRRFAPRWPRIRRCRRSPRTWPTSCYRNGRYEEAREAYERAAKLAPDLGDDLYFKLGNIAYKRRDKSTARGRAGAAPPSSIPGTSWPGPTSRCWTWPRDGRRRRASRRSRGRSPRRRLRRRGLQGQVHPPADRGADAGLRRAHLRRLPARSSTDRRSSTSACATRSRSTSPGSIGTRRPGICSGATVLPDAVRPAARGGARVERGLRVG